MKSYHLSRRFRNPIHMFVIYLIRTNFRLGIILITIRKVMGYKEVEWSTMSVSGQYIDSLFRRLSYHVWCTRKLVEFWLRGQP